MSISGISSSLPSFTATQVQQAKQPSTTGFADRIQDAVKELADAQTKATDSAKAFEVGTEADLASVMIDQQVASLGFQMALNVRNKALGAYKDIMNMPV